MIRLGVRLTVAGGREAVARLVLIVVAVAIGVALFLLTIAATQAVRLQDARYAWLLTASAPDAPPSLDGPDSAALWWHLRSDTFEGREIIRVDLAAGGPDAPVPPGLDVVPGPGEVAASPAMVDLLAATPDDQLDDRYGGTLTTVVGDAGLPSPETLLVVVGHDPTEVADDPATARVTRLSTTAPADCPSCGGILGTSSQGMALVLAVVAVALVVPVLVLVGSATRLSAARREQRFAALRLVGATPRQVAMLAASEAALAAGGGAVVGVAVALALRGPVATIPVAGQIFQPDDVRLAAGAIVLALVGAPVLAAAAARIALRRVEASPLGVRRRITPAPPRAWRIVPLVAGVGVLGWFAFTGRPDSTSGQISAYVPSIVAATIGLVLCGPWLTALGARAMAGRTARPSALIAGRRLADDPRAGFRAISGLVLAVFVGSGAVATIASVTDAADSPGPSGTALVQMLYSPVGSRPTTLSAELEEELRIIPGVDAILVLRSVDAPDGVGFPTRVVDCAELAAAPELGRCAPGAETASMSTRFGGSVIDGAPSFADVTWPTAAVAATELDALPVDVVVVANDGTAAAVERARTVLVRHLPQRFGPDTIDEMNAHGSRDLSRLQQLAEVVILASLVIAGCSLAVGVAGGVADRRRPFGLLRLSGVPLGVLRRVVALETVLPLVVTAAVAAGAGLLVADLFVQAQMERSITLPGLGFLVALLVGLGVALGVVASSFPLLARLTGPDSARDV